MFLNESLLTVVVFYFYLLKLLNVAFNFLLLLQLISLNKKNPHN